MKIFLTGGTGFIGSHLINEAHKRGYEIRALRRPGSKSRIKLDKQPYWIEGSLDGNYLGFTGKQIADVVGSENNPASISDLKFLFFSTGMFLTVLGVLEFILLGSTLMYKNRKSSFNIFQKKK